MGWLVITMPTSGNTPRVELKTRRWLSPEHECHLFDRTNICLANINSRLLFPLGCEIPSLGCLHPSSSARASTNLGKGAESQSLRLHAFTPAFAGNILPPHSIVMSRECEVTRKQHIQEMACVTIETSIDAAVPQTGILIPAGCKFSTIEISVNPSSHLKKGSCPRCMLPFKEI